MVELTKEAIILTDKERSLIEKLREVAFGKVTIFIENGVPQRIEEVRESIKL